MDNIDTMEAGREMDALIAEKVFNWRWMKYPAPNYPSRVLTLLAPPDAPGRWPVQNHYDKIWEPSDSSAERFVDWYRVHWWDNNGEISHHEGLAHYSTEIAAAWEVLEKFPAYAISHSHDGYQCRIYNDVMISRGEKMALVDANTAPLAICRAALKAVTQ